MKLFRTLVLTPLLFLTACYNGEKTLIPKQPFVPLEVEEGYNLVFQPKVDILFLVDDSGSMYSAQSQLAQNISLFTRAMEKNEFLDYHIGVITTSVGPAYSRQSGQLQGNPKFITRSTVNGLNLLERNIKGLGTNGNYIETFFDPIMLAIDPERNLNPGFFRSDAFLVLIVITDTRDQSTHNSGFYAFNSLVNMKANDVEKVLGYGVFAFPRFFGDTCFQDDGDPLSLFNFMGWFANAFNTQIAGGGSGGFTHHQIPPHFYKLTNVFSLCDSNFGQKLSEIGEDIRIRVSQKIALPVRPVDGTIRLKYGSQEIDKKWWKYDFGTNSIILDPLIELDKNQPEGSQLFVIMDQADIETTIGDPNL